MKNRGEFVPRCCNSPPPLQIAFCTFVTIFPQLEKLTKKEMTWYISLRSRQMLWQSIADEIWHDKRLPYKACKGKWLNVADRPENNSRLQATWGTFQLVSDKRFFPKASVTDIKWVQMILLFPIQSDPGWVWKSLGQHQGEAELHPENSYKVKKVLHHKLLLAWPEADDMSVWSYNYKK